MGQAKGLAHGSLTWSPVGDPGHGHGDLGALLGRPLALREGERGVGGGDGRGGLQQAVGRAGGPVKGGGERGGGVRGVGNCRRSVADEKVDDEKADDDDDEDANDADENDEDGDADGDDNDEADEVDDDEKA